MSAADSIVGSQVNVGQLPSWDLLDPNYLFSGATNSAGVALTQPQVQQQVSMKGQAKSQAYGYTIHYWTQEQAQVTTQAHLQKQKKSGGGVSQVHDGMSPSAMSDGGNIPEYVRIYTHLYM